MNNNTNNQNLNNQLLLNTASRKNSYNIAKWFNLATFIGSGLIFFIFLIATIVSAAQIRNVPNKETAVGVFILILVIALINSVISLFFWIYTKNFVNQVGTIDEVAHTAFGVFTFLFANWISGIFILIASSSFNRSQILMSLNNQQTFNPTEE